MLIISRVDYFFPKTIWILSCISGNIPEEKYFSINASNIICGHFCFLCWTWINCPCEFLISHQIIFNIAPYRVDAQKLEEWARDQNSTSLVDFSSREGEVEGILKDIAERAGGKGDFSYSRFFAIGLFRLLELANAMEPAILEKVTQFIDVLIGTYSNTFFYHMYFVFTVFKFKLSSLILIYTSSRESTPSTFSNLFTWPPITFLVSQSD